MGIEARLKNPYGNRNLPVGKGWSLSDSDQEAIAPLLKWAQLEGGECELCYDFSVIAGPGDYVMLGDGRGGGAGLMALGLKNRGVEGHVHTVDTYRDGFRVSSRRGERYRKHNEERFKKWGVSDFITQYHMTTEKACDLFRKNGMRIKVLFIDADHTYEGVKRDLAIYRKLLDDKAFIVFHDTNQEFTDRVIKEDIVNDSNLNFLHWVNRCKVYEKIG